MNEPNPSRRIVIMRGLLYASSVAFVSFDDENGEIQLISNRRIVEPIRDYLGHEAQLFITSDTEWTWMPVDDTDREESN